MKYLTLLRDRELHKKEHEENRVRSKRGYCQLCYSILYIPDTNNFKNFQEYTIIYLKVIDYTQYTIN